MNERPPTDSIRVAVNDLGQLIVEIFKAVPILVQKAVKCDARISANPWPDSR